MGEIQMKKIISAALALIVCASLTACKDTGNNSESTPTDQSSQISAVEKTAAEKTGELLKAMTFPEMISAGEDLLDAMFGISADDLTDYSVYICPSGAMPDEFGIFIAVSAQKAAEIKSKVEQRIADQTETYTTYTPDEVYKLEGSICEVNGNTVYYAICADGAKAREILN